MSSQSRKTWFDDYNEFADACEIYKGSLVDLRPNSRAVNLAMELVEEEFNRETKTAVARYLSNPSLENMVEVADGIGDSIYVLCQLARTFGIPLDRVWDAIQAANMAKVVVSADGKKTVRRREDGKILKPEGWKPADIWQILFEKANKEAVRAKAFGSENWVPTKENQNG